MKYTDKELDEICKEYPDGIACFMPVMTNAPKENVDLSRSQDYQNPYPDGMKPMASTIVLEKATMNPLTGARQVEAGNSYEIVVFPEGARTDFCGNEERMLSDDYDPPQVLRMALQSSQFMKTFTLDKPSESLLETIRYQKSPEGRRMLRDRAKAMNESFDSEKGMVDMKKMAAKARTAAAKEELATVEEEEISEAPPPPSVGSYRGKTLTPPEEK